MSRRVGKAVVGRAEGIIRLNGYTYSYDPEYDVPRHGEFYLVRVPEEPAPPAFVVLGAWHIEDKGALVMIMDNSTGRVTFGYDPA